MMIAKDLHLDVPRAFNIFLHQQRAIAERAFRFSLGSSESFLEFRCVAHNAHTAPAATQRSFDQLGKFIFRRDGHHRHAGLLRQLARLLFDPSALITSARGPMNTIPAFFTCRCKFGVLRQKSIPRMNRISARQLRRSNDLFNIEI